MPSNKTCCLGSAALSGGFTGVLFSLQAIRNVCTDTWIYFFGQLSYLSMLYSQLFFIMWLADMKKKSEASSTACSKALTCFLIVVVAWLPTCKFWICMGKPVNGTNQEEWSDAFFEVGIRETIEILLVYTLTMIALSLAKYNDQDNHVHFTVFNIMTFMVIFEIVQPWLQGSNIHLHLAFTYFNVKVAVEVLKAVFGTSEVFSTKNCLILGLALLFLFAKLMKHVYYHTPGTQRWDTHFEAYSILWWTTVGLEAFSAFLLCCFAACRDNKESQSYQALEESESNEKISNSLC